MHQVQLVMFLDAWFIVCAQYLGDASDNSWYRQCSGKIFWLSPSLLPPVFPLASSFSPSSHLPTDPRWVSVNLGVFICFNCASIHQLLGAHISKVQSVHDKLTEDMLEVCGLFFFLAKQTEYIVSLYEFSWNPYLQNPCIARNGVMTSLFTQVYQTLVPY